MQSYRVDVGVAQVILGNEVLLKCDIPSFANDFVTVKDWVDSEGITYSGNSLGNVLITKDKMRKWSQSLLLVVFSCEVILRKCW